MVAMSLIAIAFTAVFKMHSSSVNMQYKTNFYATASILASSKMDLISAGNNVPEESSGDFGDNYPGYTWTTTLTEVEADELGDFSKNFHQVDLTITWNENNSYSFRKYIYKKE